MDTMELGPEEAVQYLRDVARRTKPGCPITVCVNEGRRATVIALAHPELTYRALRSKLGLLMEFALWEHELLDLG